VCACVCARVSFSMSVQVTAVLGAAGGSHIISSTAYVLARLVALNETIKQAIDAPRLHNQLQPVATVAETKVNRVRVSIVIYSYCMCSLRIYCLHLNNVDIRLRYGHRIRL
jgi:hypothetical protein